MLAMLMGIGEAEAKCREEVRGLGADSPPCLTVFLNQAKGHPIVS